MDVDSFLVTVNQYHIDNLKVEKKKQNSSGTSNLNSGT